MVRSKEVFRAHAAAAGLEGPPLRGSLGGYAKDLLARIPALIVSADNDSDRRYHLKAMENGAHTLLERVDASAALRARPPLAKVAPAPRPPNARARMELRSAHQRRAAGIRLFMVDPPLRRGH